MGSTSPNSTIKNVTVNTLTRKPTHVTRLKLSSRLFIRMFEMRMMPIVTKLLAMSIEPSRIFGSSSKATILLKAGCCFVRNILISLYVREKNATSEPEIRKEIVKSNTAIKMSTAEAAGVMRSKENCKEFANSTTG